MTRAFVGIGAALAMAAAPLFLAGQARPPAGAKPLPAKPKPPVETDAPQRLTYPLESLRVEGNRQIPAPRIVAASGLKIGVQVQKADFDLARDRLIATGAFENVGYEFKPSAAATGFDAVLQVVEVPQLFSYRFEDIPGQADMLRSEMQRVEPIFVDKIPPSPMVLGRFTQAIQQASGVAVVGRLTSDLPGEPTILFRPLTARSNIAEVRFTGNDALPTPLLTRTLSGVAVGVPYSDAGFKQILEASLRPLYEARGRIRVTFPQVTTQKAEKVEGLVVTVAINEGPAFRLGTVRWQGVAASLQDQVEKVATFKKDDIANFDDIQAGLTRVHEKYLSAGFLKESAQVKRDIREKDGMVDLTLVVEPGPQYSMGKLSITGLDILSEPSIRKMWRLDAGKPFPAAYPDSFLARIREEDLFDNLGKTTAETQVNEASHTVDVTLRFAGKTAEDRSKEKGRQRPSQDPVVVEPPIW